MALLIVMPKLLAVLDHTIPEERQRWVSPCFLCRIIAGSPVVREPDKCEEIGWFSLEEIKNLPLAPALRKTLSRFCPQFTAE